MNSPYSSLHSTQTTIIFMCMFILVLISTILPTLFF